MALTSTSAFSSTISSITVSQSDATSTVDTDITGGTNLVLTTVEIDCLTNSVPGGETAYLKFYDNGNPTVGTSDPVLVFPVKGGERQMFQISGGGYTFSTAISMACVTDGGGTAGTTSPTQNVIVNFTTE